MEQKLLDLFPDELISVRDYKSFLNQPERIQISSQEDINDYDQNRLTTYFNFRIPLPRPAINIKSIQLARANIPNIVASFPNTELTFWYYAIPNSGTGTIYQNSLGVPGAPLRTFNISGDVFSVPGVLQPNEQVYFDGTGSSAVPTPTMNALAVIGGFQYTFQMSQAQSGVITPMYSSTGVLTYFLSIVLGAGLGQLFKPNYLRYFRLLPDFIQPELFLDEANDQLFGFNRIFEDYEDLTTELQFSTHSDPLEQTVDNQQPGQFKFVEDMVSISYNATFKKFILRINPVVQNLFAIMPCASDDPNWIAAAKILAERDILYKIGDFGVDTLIQPFILYRNLNLRLGFNWVAYPTRQADLNNLIRPHPVNEDEAMTLGRNFTSYDLVAPGYADLVNTSCIHIYTDITGGSTIDSIINKALLGSIPMNTLPLGVGFHSLPLNNPLTKIPTLINEIYIEMRTDSGQPFYIGNNGIVSLELILTY